MNTDDFKVIDLWDSVSAGSGDTVVFEYDGNEFLYESWSTEHTSGDDIYWKDGRREPIPFEYDDDEVYEFFRDVLDTWWAEYRKYVNPAREAAVQSTLAIIQAEE